MKNPNLLFARILQLDAAVHGAILEYEYANCNGGNGVCTRPILQAAYNNETLKPEEVMRFAMNPPKILRQPHEINYSEANRDNEEKRTLKWLLGQPQVRPET